MGDPVVGGEKRGEAFTTMGSQLLDLAGYVYVLIREYATQSG
jgi:hypothetical protein